MLFGSFSFFKKKKKNFSAGLFQFSQFLMKSHHSVGYFILKFGGKSNTKIQRKYPEELVKTLFSKCGKHLFAMVSQSETK